MIQIVRTEGAKIMKKLIALTLCSLFMYMSMPVLPVVADLQTTDVKTEHLVLPKKLAKKTPINSVNVSNDQVKILPYNTIQLTFAEPFNSKNALVGDEVTFLLNEGLKTQEGTEVLPAGTKFIAEVCKVEKPRAFNRSGKVYLNFKYIELPSGTQYNANARLFGKKEFLSRGKMNALGKGLGSTLGGMAVGTAAGCCIGIAAGAVIVGGFAIGMPVGFALGATAGLATPGLYYKAKAGDKINVQLVGDVNIQR